MIHPSDLLPRYRPCINMSDRFILQRARARVRPRVARAHVQQQVRHLGVADVRRLDESGLAGDRVAHVDRGIGRILDQLEQGGDLDDTLILFTSDNGACYEWGPYGFDQRSRTGKTILHKGDDLA